MKSQALAMEVLRTVTPVTGVTVLTVTHVHTKTISLLAPE